MTWSAAAGGMHVQTTRAIIANITHTELYHCPEPLPVATRQPRYTCPTKNKFKNKHKTMVHARHW